MTVVWENKQSVENALNQLVETGEVSSLPLAFVDQAISQHASKTAFEDEYDCLSFDDVHHHSLAFAAYLQQKLGVQKGEHIALMVPNMVAFPVVCLGILRTGAVQVNVNPNYTSSELRHQLVDSGATTLVIFEGAYAKFADISDATNVKNVVVVSGQGFSEAASIECDNWPCLKDCLGEGQRLNFSEVDIRANDRIFLQYTGGTTGVSKGAVLTHGNLGANILQFHDHIFGSLTPGDAVFVTALPLYHIFALMVNFLSSFAIGARNILIRNPSDMDGFVQRLKEAKFSVITGVNTLYEGIMAHKDFSQVDLSQYCFAMGGGTPILETTAAKWRAATGHDIKVGYGLSETSPVVSMQSMDQLKFTTDVGIAMPHTEIITLDDNDQLTEGLQPGELCVRGPQVTQGYWQKDDQKSDYFTSDGFFRTGDIAIRHDDGRYEIVDRKKDMILVSGFNVYPNEIESAVAQHPDVVESICIGIQDDRTGEAIKVFVVPESNADVTADDIISHCKQRLTGYKVPKQIEFRNSLPKSAVGKLLRRELRPA